MPISAVILTKNEEENIGKCLESVKWADEIIIIDDFSTDKTVEIAKDRGGKVYQRKLDNNFSEQRNFGLEKAENNWVLFLDADETISSSLAQEIVRRVKENTYHGFLILRKEIFNGKILHCTDKPSWDWSFGPIKLLRLAKKNDGIWQGRVHEKWQIKGNIGILKNPIYHHSFPNISKALAKINFYTSIQAIELTKKGKIYPGQIFSYSMGKFLKNFFWHRGIFDGNTGIIYCLLMSLHTFLVRGKAWSLKNIKAGN